MSRWIELKVRIEEKGPIGTMDIEILDASNDVDEEFLDKIFDDWGIIVTNEQWEEFLKKKRGVKNEDVV